MEASDFGGYLKRIRKEKKLTIRQLELYSKVSNAYISQMERGERGVPSPDILQKLSKPLGVSYEELMEKAGYLTKEVVLGSAIEQGLIHFNTDGAKKSDGDLIDIHKLADELNDNPETYQYFSPDVKKEIANEFFKMIDPDLTNFLIDLYINKDKQKVALNVINEIKNMKEEDMKDIIDFARFKKSQSDNK